jgi:hypothetical protein
MKNQNTAPDLRVIARTAMTDRGLDPDFPSDAIQQLNGIQGAAREMDLAIRDLRSLLWCSIDNDSSRDLDQLTVAEKLMAARKRCFARRNCAVCIATTQWDPQKFIANAIFADGPQSDRA